MPPGGLNIRWPDPPLEQEYAAAQVQALRGARLRPRQPARPHRHRQPAAALRHRHHRQILSRRAPGARRSRASTRRMPPRSACASTRWRCPGRWSAKACAISPRASKRSWSSRRSARSSRTSSRSSSTTGARTCGRASSASSTRTGDWILPSNGELTPAQIARVIATRIAPLLHLDAASPSASPFSTRARRRAARRRMSSPFSRTPYFCSGCPHNTSTRVPEGSRALAGIGCHYLAQFMDRHTATFTQMGGEGATWIGQAPFTETQHVFANLGDGTYTHSGILAIRAAVAAGRQHHLQGPVQRRRRDDRRPAGRWRLDRAADHAQLAAEGVTPDRRRHRRARQISAGGRASRTARRCATATSSTRSSASCARSPASPPSSTTRPAPPRSAAGASAAASPTRPSGSSSTIWSARAAAIARSTSNCLSVVPVETEFGRKRAIDQSSCNKDFSCLKGFCPSFVTVHGGRLRKTAQKPGVRRQRRRPAAAARAGPARPWTSPTASWSPASAAPAS